MGCCEANIALVVRGSGQTEAVELIMSRGDRHLRCCSSSWAADIFANDHPIEGHSYLSVRNAPYPDRPVSRTIRVQ
jgi:hypothetical protein